MNFTSPIFTYCLLLSIGLGCKRPDQRQSGKEQDQEQEQNKTRQQKLAVREQASEADLKIQLPASKNESTKQTPPSHSDAVPLKTSASPEARYGDSSFFNKPCLRERGRFPKIENFQNFTKETQAFLAALFAGTERQGKEALQVDLNILGYKVSHWIENPSRGVFGYLALPNQEQGHGIVVFGGTQDLFGVIADSQFATKRADGRDLTGLIRFKGLNFRGWIHTGFYDSYLSISEALENALAKIAAERNYGFYFTGHSYGGALATLAAARNTQAGRKTLGLLTAGQPRIGDAELNAHISELLGQAYVRVVHEADIVAHLPPTAEGAHSFSALSSSLPGGRFLSEKTFQVAGYVHSGELRVLSPTNELFEQQSDAASDARRDQEYWFNAKQAGLSIFNLQQAKQVRDHDAQSYFCGMVSNWLNP